MPFLNPIQTVTTTATTTPAPVLVSSDVIERALVVVTNSGPNTVDFDVQWSVDGVTYVAANVLDLQGVASGETRYSSLDRVRPNYFKVRATTQSGTSQVVVSVHAFDARFSRY